MSFAVNAAGGSTINYQFTVPNNTALTASTEVPIFKIIGGNNTWPTGAITNQRWSWITANTANFSAASIITNSYGLYVEAATAGTNATITNNWGIGVNGGGIIVRGISGTGLDIGNASSVFNVVTSSGMTSAYALTVTNGSLTIGTTAPVLSLNNSGCGLSRTSNDTNVLFFNDLHFRSTQSTTNIASFNNNGTNVFNPNSVATGAITNFRINVAVNTNQTATTNIPNFRVTGANKQWATGTVVNQYWNYLTANTASFVGASTMTNSYGLFVEAATAGTNATITNNYAAGFSGNVNVIGSLYSTGFRLVDGTQGLNKVLVSDANGNASWATSSAGYGRSINNIAINTTGAAAANTDYYYFCTATLTFTLPTAVGNTNTYYIKVTSGTLTIDTTSSQTIDGSLTIVTSVANTAFTLISDGTNWQII